MESVSSTSTNRLTFSSTRKRRTEVIDKGLPITPLRDYVDRLSKDTYHEADGIAAPMPVHHSATMAAGDHRMTHLFKPPISPEAFDTFPIAQRVSLKPTVIVEEKTATATNEETPDDELEIEKPQIWKFDAQDLHIPRTKSVRDRFVLKTNASRPSSLVIRPTAYSGGAVPSTSPRRNSVSTTATHSPPPRFSYFGASLSAPGLMTTDDAPLTLISGEIKRSPTTKNSGPLNVTAPLARYHLIPSPARFEDQELESCLPYSLRSFLTREISMGLAKGDLLGTIDTSTQAFSFDKLRKNQALTSRRTSQARVDRAIKLFIQQSGWHVQVSTVWNDHFQLTHIHYELWSTNLTQRLGAFRRFLRRLL